jgi:hypothetical protein
MQATEMYFRGITIIVVGSVEALMLMRGSLVQPRPPKHEALLIDLLLVLLLGLGE